MTSPWVIAAWCAMAYLVGGLPIGWVLVHWQRYGLDLRNFGTGNIGTSNVYRHAGIDIAVIVGPLQFAQGFLPVLAARLDGLPMNVAMLVGIFAVVGNGWPVYMRFNGGRGVAVATGVVAARRLPASSRCWCASGRERSEGGSRSRCSWGSCSCPSRCSCSAARTTGFSGSDVP